MNRVIVVASLLVCASAGNLIAAVTSTTQHGPASTSLDGSIAVGDLISGLIGTELPPLNGWHGANTDPLDQLPALTDDSGIRATGLTGLLNDFPGAGIPAKTLQYDLGGPTDIGAIQVLTGNNGLDGRVFSTFTISTSTDNGGSFNPLGYFQSDPSGTINNAGPHGSTLVRVFDDASTILASGVTNLQFALYAVDNTGGEMRDPFDGVNPFTTVDDGLTAAFVSPLVFELDVLAPIPEPTSLGLLMSVVAGALFARRQR
jgi:hypothetical protein